MSKVLNNARTLGEKLAAGDTSAILGAFVWWNLDNAIITPDDLRALFARFGETTKVPDITGTAAVRAAAARWTTDRFTTSKAKTEIVRSSERYTEIGVLQFERVSESEVAWVQKEVQIYDQDNDTWAAPPATEHGQTFRKYADKCRRYHDHRWLRPGWLKKRLIEDAKAIPLKNNGGFFFVFAEQLPIVEHLQAVTREIGRSDVMMTEVFKTQDAMSSVGSAVHESLFAELSEIAEKMEAWKATTKTASMERVLTEFRELRGRAELYSGVLEFQIEDLQAQIKAAEAIVLAKLEGVDDLPSAEPSHVAA